MNFAYKRVSTEKQVLRRQEEASATDFARLIGVSRPTLYNYIRGHRD